MGLVAYHAFRDRVTKDPRIIAQVNNIAVRSMGRLVNSGTPLGSNSGGNDSAIVSLVEITISFCYEWAAVVFTRHTSQTEFDSRDMERVTLLLLEDGFSHSDVTAVRFAVDELLFCEINANSGIRRDILAASLSSI